MRILFIGGTGVISSACTELGLERGLKISLLNRGSVPPPPDAELLMADIRDKQAVERALAGREFDAVVNWIAFSPPHVRQDIELFRGRTGQYVFISSASAYEKPPRAEIVTELTPLANPYWHYSREKIACEEALMQECERSGFPVIVVRPSHTYGMGKIPLALGAPKPYTVVERMRQGKALIVPGDGESLWTLTHNTDFAKGFMGLLGRREAVGEAYHITSDEALSWNRIYEEIGKAAGAVPRLAHIPADFLVETNPDWEGGLLGDKIYSTIFDNSKIKALVPEFKATTSLADGLKRVMAWYDADPSRKETDAKTGAAWDRVIAAYRNDSPKAPRP